MKYVKTLTAEFPVQLGTIYNHLFLPLEQIRALAIIMAMIYREIEIHATLADQHEMVLPQLTALVAKEQT